MTEEVETLEETATLGDALALIGETGVRHIPIMRDGGVIGVISDRDLRRVEGLMARSVSDPTLGGADVLAGPVTSLLAGQPVCVAPDDSADAVIDAMLGQHVGATCVVDATGKLCGILSYVDILRAARGRL
jgi:CBS domain-containing protein